ncbi:MAG: hypothetical protein IK005_03890 [Paludibacteraceae bacterium]|nr:hypothetical protein [Paludibacteraceae bacterium]MBR4839604.1 hypothetical protein [Paludibacteraceae bacterium]
MEVILNDGIITDYNDFYLWVEKLEVNANAKFIEKDENEEAVSATSAVIKKLISCSDFENEDEYNDAVEKMQSEDYDAMAEFMTDEDTCFVGVELVDEEQPVDSFEIGDDVYYC